MRFLNLIPRSNENKTCMRVEKREFAREFSQLSYWGQTRTRVAWELMRVEKREFAWEFSQPSYPSQTRTRVACMRVEKREFVWEFSQPSCPSQTKTRVAWELRSESLYESFLNLHTPVKRERDLHESWEARVCMRVFSTLMPRSNENKSWMRVEKREFAREFSQLSCSGQTRTRLAWELRSESLYESFLNSHAPVKREQELHESWEARVCVRVFSTLMPRSSEIKSYMRVKKREFAWEFSQLSWPGQTRTRVAWELRSEGLHESFLNSHAPVKREQELHESWEARVCVRVFSTLMARSNENKSYRNVSSWFKRDNQLKVGKQTQARIVTLINSHPHLTRPQISPCAHQCHLPVVPPRSLKKGLSTIRLILIIFGYFYRGQFIEESEDKITVSFRKRRHIH
jgi:hypothetical protein